MVVTEKGHITERMEGNTLILDLSSSNIGNSQYKYYLTDTSIFYIVFYIYRMC